MSLMDKIEQILGEEFNELETEKGALGYRTTGKPLLDLNFSVASLRSESEETIVLKFKKAFFDNKLLALKWLFFAGDVRGGLGERRLFKTVMTYLAFNESEIAEKLLPLVPEYTRWDNLLVLLDTPLKGSVVELLKAQLALDEEKMANEKPVSLCAKWMPSANASSELSKRYAKILVKEFGITEKEYRKRLAKLRAYLDVIEVKMSRGDWAGIDYEAVPSKANVLYERAFLLKDQERRTKYLSALEKGEAEINASVLFPHDIVHKYSKDAGWSVEIAKYNVALEEMWKNLPDYVQGAGSTICVADGSGSMTMHIGNSNVSALSVANALAIYFAERCSGEFKDKYITFSENPQLVDLSKGKTLRDKLGIAITHCEVANTNIEAVFDLILMTAIKNKMTQDELPQNILILSDMEFDCCVETSEQEADFEKLFTVFAKRYAQYGYKLPRLVFWNLNSRTGAIPVKENEHGVALVSGFSPVIVKMVLSGKTDPFDCMLEAINAERYNAVEEAVKNVLK